MRQIILLVLLFIMAAVLWSEEVAIQDTVMQDTLSVAKPVVTFLEFGSTTCIPCKMMEKVMEEVRVDYGDKVEVIFHNVNEEKKLSGEYGIKMIPTQIFLDSEGKEFHRHIGYYPTEEIAKVLLERGIAPDEKQ
ncbi:MAG: thioredoxin family protein [Candidatus Stygibacter australis]|nr:thioredoxin family protein [Candidatus Stygibacter australis]MDP8322482.1 thioredoxin family protein [Candidatus Stygibacter australis]